MDLAGNGISLRCVARGATFGAVFLGAILQPGAVFLRGEEVASSFEKKARGELSRLKSKDEAKKREEEIQPGVEFSIGDGLTSADLRAGILARAQDERDRREEEKEKEEEENSRNWLVDGVEKMSGEKELSEEERASLMAPGSGTRLIDRMVAARAEENEKREKGKDAAEKADKRIKMDEETDRALEKWTGVALPRGAKGGDALREMEEGILNAGLENEPGGAPRGEAAAVENGGNTSTRNPFLDALTSGNSIFQDGGQGKSAKSRRGVFAPVSTGPGSGGSGNPAMLNLEQFSGFTPDTKSGRNPFLAALEFPLSRPPVSSASAPIQQNPLLSGSGISALPGESGTVDLPNPRKNSSKELPDCSLCGKPFYIAHLWHLCYYFPVREPNGWAWERVSTRTRK